MNDIDKIVVYNINIKVETKVNLTNIVYYIFKYYI